jgi:tetratricopeptide (TPR) repeat protein
MAACMSAPPEEPAAPDVLPPTNLYPPLVRILVDPPVHRSEHRWSGETAGLAVVLLEAGLIELPGVVPMVAEAPVAVGLEGALLDGASEWRLSVEIEYPDDDRVELYARLCPEPGRCVGGHGSATRTAPGPGVAEILVTLAGDLGIEVPEGLIDLWKRPVSEDDYAALLAGRAAAKFYGFMEPVAARLWGHRTADPSERAVMVDPTMAVAHWIKAREAVRRYRPKDAMEALDRALDEGAHRAWLYAARASLLARVGQWERARGAWDALAEASPEDARYVVPRIRAYLASGAPSAALEILSALPGRLLDEAETTELRVAIAEALGPGEDYETLLRAWADAASGDPEPLRRQVAYRLRLGRNAEALALLRDLEDRGAVAEAHELAIAIGNELGRYGEAADDAQEMGFVELARRIRTRAAMDSGTAPDPAVLAESGATEENLVAARILVASNPTESLRLVDAILRRDPWLPEALAVRVRALEALDDRQRLGAALEDLRAADPALYRTTVTGEG